MSLLRPDYTLPEQYAQEIEALRDSARLTRQAANRKDQLADELVKETVRLQVNDLPIFKETK